MKQFVQARLQRYWDIRAAGNFAFGGTGSGLLMAAAVGRMAGMDTRIAIFAGLLFVGIGLFCVWLEIGKPWRSINVFFHPQTSWMTREAVAALFLFMAGAGAMWVDARLVYAAAILALLFLYCQARILFASRGIPAWSQKEIVPLILIAGVTEGAALWALMGSQSTHLAGVLMVLAILREVAREFYRRALVARKAPVGTLVWLHSREEKILMAIRLTAIVMLGASSLGVSSDGLLHVAALLTLLTGWAIKVGIVVRAAFQRGFIIEHTPARGRGPTEVVVPS